MVDFSWSIFLVLNCFFVPFLEEEDVAWLECQALEDLGLLIITSETSEDPDTTCTKIQDNGDLICAHRLSILGQISLKLPQLSRQA